MMLQKHARPLFRRPGIGMLGDRVFFPGYRARTQFLYSLDFWLVRVVWPD